MLTSLTLYKKLAKRVGSETERTFMFAPGVNLLVGPNGSGKSTIISTLMYLAREREVDADVKFTCDVEVRTFDFESMNPRTKHEFSNNILFEVTSRFHSHGETNISLSRALFEPEFAGAVVLLDEPDQALDLAGIVELQDVLKKCPAVQIIASVHHPLLILSDFHTIEMVPGYRDLVKDRMFALKETKI